MRRRRLLRNGLAWGAILAPGCADGPEPDDGTPTLSSTPAESPTASPTRTYRVTESDSASIELTDDAYVPRALRVAPGTTVTWINESATSHTVQSAAFHDVAAEWSFYSADFPPGRTVTYDFPDTGVYEYYCTVHGRDEMCGVVLVGDARSPGELPCKSAD